MKQFTRTNLVLEHKNLSFLQTSFLDYITPLCLYIELLYTREYDKNVHLLRSANDWDSNVGETHKHTHSKNLQQKIGQKMDLERLSY